MRGVGNHTPPQQMQHAPREFGNSSEEHFYNASEKVKSQVAYFFIWGVPVHTEIAREIASWHEAPTINHGIVFGKFANDGTIDGNFLSAIRRELRYWLYSSDGDEVNEMIDAVRALTALQGYVLESNLGEKCEA